MGVIDAIDENVACAKQDRLGLFQRLARFLRWGRPQLISERSEEALPFPKVRIGHAQLREHREVRARCDDLERVFSSHGADSSSLKLIGDD